MANKPWEVMTESDYDTYKNNKYMAETSGETDGKLNMQNERLRNKYNIVSDDYSYSDLQNQSAFGRNAYDRAADSGLETAKRYRRYSDPYAKDLYNTYNELKNFSYNPENDPAYKAYKDAYARQGAAAQDKTYSDLTALSGGRNNSWASAATAQAGQAYAQKTTDMIPQLAQQAYNKLLQEYNVINSQSEREMAKNQAKFDNAMQEYNANREQAEQYRNNAQQRLAYDRQLQNDEINNRQKEQQISNAVLAGIKTQQEIQKNDIELEYLTQNEQMKLILGQLDIEAAKALIAKRKA